MTGRHRYASGNLSYCLSKSIHKRRVGLKGSLVMGTTVKRETSESVEQ